MWKNEKFSHRKNFSSNQLFSNSFSKTVTFTEIWQKYMLENVRNFHIVKCAHKSNFSSILTKITWKFLKGVWCEWSSNYKLFKKMYSLVFNQSKKLIRIIKTALCIYLDESFTINFTKNKTDSGVENGVSRVHTTHS